MPFVSMLLSCVAWTWACGAGTIHSILDCNLRQFCSLHDSRLHEPALGIMRLVVGSCDGSQFVDPTHSLRTPLFRAVDLGKDSSAIRTSQMHTVSLP